jgi:hypothetical protein
MLQFLTGTLLYTVANEAVACFEKEKGKEWKTSIAVDEDQADAFNELYPKQSAKVVKTADFEEIYKCPAPFPDEKKQYVITLRLNTKLGNGEPVPEQYQPKVLQVIDGERVDITKEKLVGNGSKGKVSITHYAGKMGDVARLKNILVTELVEYEGGTGGSNDGSEFDDEPAVKKPAAKKAPAKKSTEVKESSAAKDVDEPF